MHIYVDADACPVIRIVENIARKYNIETTLICDTNHVLTSDYSDVVTVSTGADAVDFKLVNLCTRDDIVVTQDYGVAAMALSKGAYAIHQSGKWYTNDNIDQMLMQRHITKCAKRASSKNHNQFCRLILPPLHHRIYYVYFWNIWLWHKSSGALSQHCH